MADFCYNTRQKVNREKIEILFSKNVNYSRSWKVSMELDFGLILNLGKYFGISFHHKRVTKEVFSYVSNRVKQRFSIWKSASIALLERVTLSIQTSVLLVGLCDVVEKYTKSFLWGSKNG